MLFSAVIRVRERRRRRSGGIDSIDGLVGRTSWEWYFVSDLALWWSCLGRSLDWEDSMITVMVATTVDFGFPEAKALG